MGKKRNDSKAGQGARGPAKKPKKVLLQLTIHIAHSSVIAVSSSFCIDKNGYTDNHLFPSTHRSPELVTTVQAKAAPLPEAPNDSEVEVSDEDVDFVDEYSQRLGFLTSLDRKQIDRFAMSPRPR